MQIGKIVNLQFDELREYKYHLTSQRDIVNAERFQAFINQTKKPFHRETVEGHVTASAFIVDSEFKSILLIHHKKHNMWLQPGGHCDGVSDVLFGAIREANEETGISELNQVADVIFDIDIHLIPENAKEQAHYHYDVRFLFTANIDSPLSMNKSEVNQLAWIKLNELEKYSQLPSVLIVKEKLLHLPIGNIR